MQMKWLLPVVVCCVWMGCSADLAEKGWVDIGERLRLSQEKINIVCDWLALISRVNLLYVYLSRMRISVLLLFLFEWIS